MDCISPIKIVCNPGNGAAGHVIDELEKQFKELSVPIEFVKINFEADGTFPNGVPNPLLPQYREVTSQEVIRNKADLGIAWGWRLRSLFSVRRKRTVY